MEAIRELKDFKKVLDVKLKSYLDHKTNEAQQISPTARELMEHISDLTLRGGKRIRAALLFYSYLAHGGQDKQEIIKAAMAMEMSETYLLIHDDIMDDDNLRRGGNTIHSSYKKIAENKYPNKTNANHFGISMGVLAGDIACALSNELLSDANFGDKFKNRALYELNRIYSIEGYGQAMDILSSIKNNVSKENIIQIQQLKTVPYTIDGPVKIGAILAGVQKEKVDRLANYTVPLGTAFQIQDDILGMFGTEEKLGKPVTSDLREGKRTLLIISALEKAKPDQKEIIELNLGNKRTSINGLKAVRSVIEDTGSLDESKKLAVELAQKSIDALNKLELRKEGKEFLLGIADYIIKREY